ncbi:MAG: Zn-ribbon containing protein [Candidatus Anstonellales archaeon]
MHKCLRCGKLIKNIEEAEEGCRCGSKVFLFQGKKEIDDVGDAEWIEKELTKRFGTDGHAIVLDLENVRMKSRGVFELNINSLMKNDPIVVKDTNGVYYIKLP